MNQSRDDEYGSLSDLMGSFDEPAEPDSLPAGDPGSPRDDDADSAAEAEQALPEGLPAEYLEAFRRGYERARRGEEPTVALERELAEALEARREESRPEQPHREEPRREEPRREELRTARREPAAADTTAVVPGKGVAHVGVSPYVRTAEGALGAVAAGSGQGSLGRETSTGLAGADHEPTVAIPAEAFRRPSYDGAERERPAWLPLPLPMVAAAGIALVLVLAAFGVGRLFADDGAESASGSASGSESSGSGGSQGERAPYDGPVDAVAIVGGRATCQAASSVDAAGNPTTYEPAKAFDSDISTAWRCDGSGRGQRFTVTLPQGTTVAEVGLVPGYAKTDPVSGVDRYAENNRITKVRWRFDDGTSVVQRFKGRPTNRSMRTIRVPETATSTVVIKILRSKPGVRNAVAISEIRIAAPAG